ncbi:hypothetical protein [Leifsonia sp. Leaf264]|uniref:hypothetical protein n=1 Tax=Leifsonia sp. Leaf264 TaxID=1736314 RepID=UPI0006F8B999|nr:hypothetical protein [Leifsonia sp. Leaf264]KQO98583.1 hypothetical protein ASF30_11010 [Leifsonia sp. Leaf264]
MAKNADRIVKHAGYNYASMTVNAYRAQGSQTGEIRAFGRTNAAERQDLADKMASVVETATITEIEKSVWRVDFEVTHKIVPIAA